MESHPAKNPKENKKSSEHQGLAKFPGWQCSMHLPHTIAGGVNAAWLHGERVAGSAPSGSLESPHCISLPLADFDLHSGPTINQTDEYNSFQWVLCILPPNTESESGLGKVLSLQLVSEVTTGLQTVLPQTFQIWVIYPSLRVGRMTKYILWICLVDFLRLKDPR